MNNLAKYRVFKNKRQLDIANTLNISLSSYRRLEKKTKGRVRGKDIIRINRLANYYNVNPKQLFSLNN